MNTQPDNAEPQTHAVLPDRRAGDAALLFLDRAGADAVAVVEVAAYRGVPDRLADAVLLIDLGDDALVLCVADAHVVPCGQGGAELRGRVAAMADSLRLERDRLRRRLRMPDHLLRYADRLGRARTGDDVYAALRDVAVSVVSAYAAAVFIAAGERADAPPGSLRDAPFDPLPDARLQLASLPAATATCFLDARLVTRADTDAQPAGALAPLSALLHATGAAQLLCAPVGANALLVLVERRRDRVLTGEDRDLLDALVRQAETALAVAS